MSLGNVTQNWGGGAPELDPGAGVGADAQVQTAGSDATAAPASACGPDACAPMRPPVVNSASAADYMDTTGPLATPLGRVRAASIDLWAVPGATLDVRDEWADDGGGPKSLARTVVKPDPSGQTFIDAWKQQNGISTSTAQLKGGEQIQARAPGSYQLQTVTVPPEDQWGLVKARVDLPADADWQVGDRLKISESSGARGPSQPVTVSLADPRGGGARRPAFAFGTRIDGNDEGGEVRACAHADRAVPPGASVQLFFNGEAVGAPVTADDCGRFDLATPGRLCDGQWDVGVSLPGASVAPTLLPLNGSAPADLVSRVSAGATAIREQLRKLPSDCTLPIDVSGLPRGFPVTITDAAGGAVTRLAADDSGRIAAQIPNVAPGDVLKVSFGDASGRMASQSQWSSFAPPPVTLAVPTDAAGAARNAAIDAAVGSFSLPSQALATALFGPYGPGKDFTGDYAAALRGTLAGIAAKGGGGDPLAQYVQKNGSDAMKQGLSWGVAYTGSAVGGLSRGTGRPEQDWGRDVGLRLLQAGASHMVAVGGYDMLHPERSAPLEPAVQTDPSLYEMAMPGLAPLRFQAGGYTPQNINRNAIVFTAEWNGLAPGGG
jgi:hypothetical protein